MKNKVGKLLYYLLMLAVGVCMIIGGYINIKKNSGYLVVIGGLVLGIGIVLLALQGFIKIVKSQ